MCNECLLVFVYQNETVLVWVKNWGEDIYIDSDSQKHSELGSEIRRENKAIQSTTVSRLLCKLLGSVPLGMSDIVGIHLGIIPLRDTKVDVFGEEVMRTFLKAIVSIIIIICILLSINQGMESE